MNCPSDSAAVVLTVVGSDELSAHAERVTAAAGARLVSVAAPGRRRWLGAAAVLLDDNGARCCLERGLPRRDRVMLLAPVGPQASVWQTAVAVGAEHVFTLPAQEALLVGALAEAVESGSGLRVGAGTVIAVLPGRGGGGASVFATALAQCAGDALLIDLDEHGGGIDLLAGAESQPGLRWPDMGGHGGRLAWPAVRQALPRREGVSILSAARSGHDVEPELVGAFVDAGRRGGVTVICDAPRHLSPVTRSALELADLVVVVTTCDLRGVAACAALTAAVRTINSNVGVVLRGPAPGGLSAREAADVIAAPLLAAVRVDLSLAEHLERGGLRLGPRSRLAGAARRVLATAAAARADDGRAAVR